MSLFPSVWRTSGCQSHFVIWNDQILLLGQADESLENETMPGVDMPTPGAVLEFLPRNSLAHFSDLAEQLNAVPWDVLAVCRELVRDRRAIEGIGKQTGQFRRL